MAPQGGATLHLVLRLRGGGISFTDFCQQPKVIECNRSSKAPSWRKAKPGLSIEGKCSNVKCEAYKHTVIINMGVSVVFKLGVPIVKNPTNCPMCDCYVKLITCAFNNCEFRYFAFKETTMGLSKEKSEWKRVDDNYHRFDESNQASYNSLLIETKYHHFHEIYKFTEIMS